MNDNIVDLKELKDKEMADAYAWALEFQRCHGFYSESVKLILDMGDHIDDDDGTVVVSLFVNNTLGKAIMRRDWPADRCIRFNIISNLEEIKSKAPNTYRRLVQNGLNLYRSETGGSLK